MSTIFKTSSKNKERYLAIPYFFCTLLSIYGKYVNKNVITASAITLSILILIINYLKNTRKNYSKIFLTILILFFICDLMSAIVDTSISVWISMIGTIVWSFLLLIEIKAKITVELNTIINKLILSILGLSCGIISFVMSPEIGEYYIGMLVVTIITILSLFFAFVAFMKQKLTHNLLYVVSLMLFILSNTTYAIHQFYGKSFNLLILTYFIYDFSQFFLTRVKISEIKDILR